jgi:hypothetical protein
MQHSIVRRRVFWLGCAKVTGCAMWTALWCAKTVERMRNE